MAPEEAKHAQASPQSDVYSLGCLAHFLLTGTPVFAGTESFQILLAHQLCSPVPVSLRATQAIPREVDRLILSCLEKRPESRPADANVLERWLSAIQP